MDILSLLAIARDRGASDVHLGISNPPIFRIKGSLEPADDMAAMTVDDLDQAIAQLTTPEQREVFQQELELDFAYSVPDVGRVRCNAAWQKGTIKFAIRILPSKISTVDELGVPQVCKDLVLRPRGMVVISGPTGSGKSTTLAAMIDHLNSTERRHVVTIEDPIEYVYSSKKCVISQRQLGSDTHSFAQALKHVLRQDPDVILVGEMRDPETAAAALTIAETGHLILTTGHAPSSSQAVERIVDMFPPHERSLAQSRLASLLLGVISQTLVPTADGKGRVAAVEVMLCNSAVKNLIRDGKIYQIPNMIRTNTQIGMMLLDQALADLHKQGKISQESMLSFCNDRDETEKLVGARTPSATYTQAPSSDPLDMPVTLN